MRYNTTRSPHDSLAAGRQAGMASFFAATYTWMAVGLTLMGLMAYLVSTSPVLIRMLYGNAFASLGLSIGWIFMVSTIQSRIPYASSTAATNMFLAFSVCTGLLFGSVFLVYSGATLTMAFGITAASFASMATYGAVTKRDLAPVQEFMMIGLFGVIIASLINLFMHSEAIYWVSTYMIVFIYAGLTAYYNQALRQMYIQRGASNNLAILGALILSISFLNLFLAILRIVGDNRRD